MRNDYIICGIYGVIADTRHRQHLAQANDWTAYHAAAKDDALIRPVENLVRAWSLEFVTLFVGDCRRENAGVTIDWMRRNRIDFCDNSPIFRESSDWRKRPDFFLGSIVEKFGRLELAREKVSFVIEAHDPTVEALRNAGFFVLQPNAGF